MLKVLHDEYGGCIWDSGGGCMILTLRIFTKEGKPHKAIHIGEEYVWLTESLNLKDLIWIENNSKTLAKYSLF